MLVIFEKQKKATVQSMNFAKRPLSVYVAALAMGFVTCCSNLRRFQAVAEVEGWRQTKAEQSGEKG